MRLALEPVGMLGAHQQRWFATMDLVWTIPVWTDMTGTGTGNLFRMSEAYLRKKSFETILRTF